MGFGTAPPNTPECKILRRPGDFHLVVIQSAQPIRDRRNALRKHRSIGDDQSVRLQALAVLLHEIPQVDAAHFLFALDHHFHIERKFSCRFVQRFKRLDVDVHLALIVGRAAAKQIAVAHRRLKRGTGPQVQRLGGLHVIVPVKKNRRFAGSVQRFAIHQWMHFRGNDFDLFEARRAQLCPPPNARPFDIRLVLALGAHARNAQKFLQLVQVFFALGFDVVRSGSLETPAPRF